MKNLAAGFLALLAFSANTGSDLIFADGFEGCSTNNWNGGVTGSPIAKSPPSGVPRLEGECVLQMTAAGSVKDTTPFPPSSSRVRIRFYFLSDLNTGAPNILSVYADDAAISTLFNISHDGSSIVFDTSGAGGSSSPPIDTSGEWWHLVEVDWDAIDGVASIWVDKDATSEVPDAVVPSGFGFVESVILGPGISLDGQILFDAYESRSMNAIGPLPGCAGIPGGVCIFQNGFEATE